MKKNLEYSKSRHIFESTNKFKVMKKLSLILGIVLCTTLSYGQNVKKGIMYHKQTEHVKDSVITYVDTTLDVGCELIIYRFKDTSLFSTNDVIKVWENKETTEFIVDSVDNERPVPLIYVTNKVSNKHFKIQMYQECGARPNDEKREFEFPKGSGKMYFVDEFKFVIRNEDDTSIFYYKVIF